MNRQSSRSHAVCRIFVECSLVGKADDEGAPEAATTRVCAETDLAAWRAGSIEDISSGITHAATSHGTTRAVLTLCDLAGSEDVGRSGATGQALSEAKKINTSLSALGNVINALTEMNKGAGGGGSSHVPFRDSVLTRLLQQSIGGNCKTTLVTCISPADGDLTETLSTLRFAARARRVKNVARANVSIDSAALSAKADELAESLQRRLHSSEEQLRAAQRRCEQRAATGLTLAIRLTMRNRQMAAAVARASMQVEEAEEGGRRVAEATLTSATAAAAAAAAAAEARHEARLQEERAEAAATLATMEEELQLAEETHAGALEAMRQMVEEARAEGMARGLAEGRVEGAAAARAEADARANAAAAAAEEALAHAADEAAAAATAEAVAKAASELTAARSAMNAEVEALTQRASAAMAEREAQLTDELRREASEAIDTATKPLREELHIAREELAMASEAAQTALADADGLRHSGQLAEAAARRALDAEHSRAEIAISEAQVMGAQTLRVAEARWHAERLEMRKGFEESERRAKTQLADARADAEGARASVTRLQGLVETLQTELDERHKQATKDDTERAEAAAHATSLRKAMIAAADAKASTNAREAADARETASALERVVNSLERRLKQSEAAYVGVTRALEVERERKAELLSTLEGLGANVDTPDGEWRRTASHEPRTRLNSQRGASHGASTRSHHDEAGLAADDPAPMSAPPPQRHLPSSHQIDAASNESANTPAVSWRLRGTGRQASGFVSYTPHASYDQDSWMDIVSKAAAKPLHGVGPVVPATWAEPKPDHYTTTGQLAARGAIAGLKVWSQAQRKNVWDSGVDAWVDGRASRYG